MRRQGVERYRGEELLKIKGHKRHVNNWLQFDAGNGFVDADSSFAGAQLGHSEHSWTGLVSLRDMAGEERSLQSRLMKRPLYLRWI